MTDSMDGDSATSTLALDVEELCAFFRRHCKKLAGEPYELLQARSEVSSAKWGPIWTFEARNHHAAEKAGWMARRLVDPSVVPVRHACRVRLRRHSGQANQFPDTAEVVVVTVLPNRIQFVLILANGARVTDLPFLRCGGAQVVAVAMGMIPTGEEGDNAM